MDLKYLLTAGALALAFVACDNTTSATTDGDAMIGQKGATTEETGSSPKSSSSKGKISSSSNEVLPDDDEDEVILQYDDGAAIVSTKCTGEITDDHWHAYVKETRNDLESVGTIDVSIDGTTMTTIIEGSADMGSTELCAFFETISESDSGETSENDEAFGPATEESLS